MISVLIQEKVSLYPKTGTQKVQYFNMTAKRVLFVMKLSSHWKGTNFRIERGGGCGHLAIAFDIDILSGLFLCNKMTLFHVFVTFYVEKTWKYDSVFPNFIRDSAYYLVYFQISTETVLVWCILHFYI